MSCPQQRAEGSAALARRRDRVPSRAELELAVHLPCPLARGLGGRVAKRQHATLENLAHGRTGRGGERSEGPPEECVKPGRRVGEAHGATVRIVLSAAESTLLRALKCELARRFGDRLVGLKLFGSRARGEGRDDSDLDVLVDVRDVTPEERGAVLDLAHDLGLEADLVISPLVLRPGVTPRPEILREAVPL